MYSWCISQVQPASELLGMSDLDEEHLLVYAVRKLVQQRLNDVSHKREYLDLQNLQDDDVQLGILANMQSLDLDIHHDNAE